MELKNLENQKQRVGMSTKLEMRNANLHKRRYFITLTVKILFFLFQVFHSPFILVFHFLFVLFALRVVK